MKNFYERISQKAILSPSRDIYKVKNNFFISRNLCNRREAELAQVLSREFCEICKNTFFINTSGGCFLAKRNLMSLTEDPEYYASRV